MLLILYILNYKGSGAFLKFLAGLVYPLNGMVFPDSPYRPAIRRNMKILKEKWKPIRNFPGYEISNYGKVTSFRKRGIGVGLKEKSKLLQPSATISNSYLKVILCNNFEQKSRTIHSLVLEHFIGLKPYGMEGCHDDGNKLNNCVSNLRWDTRKNNELDNIKNDVLIKGSKHWNSRITENDVLSIRKMYNDNVSMRAISINFNISETNVCYIVRRKTWRHVL